MQIPTILQEYIFSSSILCSDDKCQIFNRVLFRFIPVHCTAKAKHDETNGCSTDVAHLQQVTELRKSQQRVRGTDRNEVLKHKCHSNTCGIRIQMIACTTVLSEVSQRCSEVIRSDRGAD